MSKESKQMGAAISRLIGVAQQVKQKDIQASQPTYPQGQGEQRVVYSGHMDNHWREVAMKQSKTIKEQANLIKKQHEDINKLQGRKTLANYSIDEIERELIRRLNQHK